MTWSGLFILLALALLLVGSWLSWTARRLDEMHKRIDLGHESLRTQLVRRSAIVLELAGSGLLDDAEAVILADGAQWALRVSPEERDAAESRLSEALRAVLSRDEVGRLRASEEGGRLLDDLSDACARVELARRIHNGQVVSARALRATYRVRLFALAGRAPHPRMIDLDDRAPEALR